MPALAFLLAADSMRYQTRNLTSANTVVATRDVPAELLLQLYRRRTSLDLCSALFRWLLGLGILGG